MRGNKGPLERNYPQIWAPPFYWSRQWASLHGGDSSGLAKILKIK
jgi:hypothetical protein